MSEYVPSEDDVKIAWADRRLFLDSLSGGASSPDAVYDAEFYRFLARVRRDAAREALTLYMDELVDGLEAEQLERFRDQNYPEEPQ